jgi:hypothetical protein
MRFPFISPATRTGEGSLMPLVPIKLRINDREINAHGLLDTGATVNVLPFSMGLSLGANWDAQTIPLQLGGNLASAEARALFVDAFVEGCPSIKLAFAWTRADNVPLLLGQTNFFMEFDVLFARSALFFEVHPKGTFF